MQSRLKIIICTTLRDFKGSENDDIQRLFLKSLETQSYDNFEVVITLFGEKKVEEELSRYKFKTTFYNGNANGFRYSLSQVLLNAFDYAKKRNYANYIILWTTCDVIYDKNFFKTIIDNYIENILGTSHPHKTYSSANDYKEKISSKKENLFSGFDLMYFDKSFLEGKDIQESLQRYTYYDWGIFEHFLISLSELNKNSNRNNLYEDVKISKIENNRWITKDPNKFLSDSHKRNAEMFKKFLSEQKLSLAYLDLTYCHLKFRLTKNTVQHSWKFRKDFAIYIFRRMMKIFGNMIRNKFSN